MRGSAALLLLALGGCVVAPSWGVSEFELDFGGVPLEQVRARSIVITNDTDDALPVVVVGLLGGPDAEAAFTVEPLASVEPWSSGHLLLRFAPGVIGDHRARLEAEIGGVAHSFLIRGAGIPGADADGDGFSAAEGDCDDTDPAIHPFAEELCDGIDGDCDGELVADGASELDRDRDGVRVCAGDCDDTSASVHPGAEEVCDGVDSDCDGLIGDLFDLDGDGATPCEGDCDDLDPTVNSAQVELCDDGRDNDCSGGIDDLDLDGDGYSPCVEGDCDSDPLRRPTIVQGSAPLGGDGSREAPYQSLTQGWQAALSGEIGFECNVLYILDGEYEVNLVRDETVSLSLPVVVRGESRDGVVLRPADATQPVIRFEPARNFETLSVSSVGFDDDRRCPVGPSQAILLAGNQGADLVLEDVRISRFKGRAVDWASGSVDIRDSEVADNGACEGEPPDGGGISSDHLVVATETTFVGNRGRFGGAIDARLQRIAGGTFVANSATEHGGASRGLSVEAVGAVFASNVADGSGGAIAISSNLGTGTLELERNTFVDNAAASGSALHGTVWGVHPIRTRLVRNIVVGEPAVADIELEVASGSADLEDNTLFLPEGGPASVVLGPDQVDTWAGHPGLLESDPLFVQYDAGDWENNDLTLQEGSPSEGRGHTAP